MKTLRDEFAMAALTVMHYDGHSNENIAKEAYAIADAMMSARGDDKPKLDEDGWITPTKPTSIQIKTPFHIHSSNFTTAREVTAYRIVEAV